MVAEFKGGWIEKKPIHKFSNTELIDELLRRGYSVTVKKEKKRTDLGFI